VKKPGRTHLMESQRNRTSAAILRAILREGPLGRKRLAAATGASPTTVTRIVADLVERGALLEVSGHRMPDRTGRPETPLDLPGGERLVVGAHLHPQRTAIGAYTLRGECVCEADLPAAGTSTEERSAEAASLARTFLGELGGSTVLGIGIATPWAEQHRSFPAPRPWDVGHAQLETAVRAATGLPVRVDSNVRALAVEHYWWSALHGDVLTVLVGRSVGLAHMREEELVWSERGTGGMVSHLLVPGSSAPCECGQSGCIAATCTDDALLARAITTGALPAGAVQQDLYPVSEEDGEALRALRIERAEQLGRVLPAIITLVDPERTILRGAIGAPDEVERCLSIVRDRYRSLVGRDAAVEHRLDSVPGGWTRASAALALHTYLAAPFDVEEGLRSPAAPETAQAPVAGAF